MSSTKKKPPSNNEALGGGQDYIDLFESIRDGVYISDLAGNLQTANQALSNIFGYTREELLTLKTTRFYKNTKDRAAFKKEMKKRGYVIDYELQLQRKDGSAFVGVLNSTARRDDKGNIIGYQGIVRDISIQKFMVSITINFGLLFNL